MTSKIINKGRDIQDLMITSHSKERGFLTWLFIIKIKTKSDVLNLIKMKAKGNAKKISDNQVEVDYRDCIQSIMIELVNQSIYVIEIPTMERRKFDAKNGTLFHDRSKRYFKFSDPQIGFALTRQDIYD